MTDDAAAADAGAASTSVFEQIVRNSASADDSGTVGFAIGEGLAIGAALIAKAGRSMLSLAGSRALALEGPDGEKRDIVCV